ncbi:MAG: hypothetical protein AB7F50_03370 [Fimbriimonadaceae bacterium]
MATPHPALTLAVVFAGSVAGGALITSVRSAQGQQVPPNVQTSEVLYVPAGGLKIVGSGNRELGRIAEVGGNAAFVLFDKEGNASVSLVTGTSGRMNFLAQDGASLAVTGDEKSINLSARSSGVGFSLGNRIYLSTADNRSSLRLSAPGGTKELTLSADPSVVAVTGRGQGEQFQLAFEEQSSLTLRGKGMVAGFEAHGDGRAAVRSKDGVLWQVPEAD